MGIKSKYNKYALFEKYGKVYKVIEDQTLIADIIAKFERKHEGEECCIFFKLFAGVFSQIRHFVMIHTFMTRDIMLDIM